MTSIIVSAVNVATCSLFIEAASNSNFMDVEWYKDIELEGIRRMRSLLNLRNFSGVCLEGLTKTSLKVVGIPT